MELVLISNNKEQTQEIAKIIAQYALPSYVITMNGDLGAGKTTFTQGFGQELGIKSNINSPTFNILKCYFGGRVPLYHIDAYRLEDNINVDIGLEEVIEGDGISIIEWPEFIQNIIPSSLNIKIEILSNNSRKIIIEGKDKYEEIVKVLKEKFNDISIVR